ncbi:hypothetical protein LSTR_LSTR011301 [Laodelphax striatellus]|uniref:Uncharacterized protein n=1 Tax=Laodelphax striatellus TaxID=195883 RepID=A0A482WGV1_LAOST|nr:hypothetical protein LSTR_LSTR011301 [Laodelphax striatellus]
MLCNRLLVQFFGIGSESELQNAIKRIIQLSLEAAAKSSILWRLQRTTNYSVIHFRRSVRSASVLVLSFSHSCRLTQLQAVNTVVSALRWSGHRSSYPPFCCFGSRRCVSHPSQRQNLNGTANKGGAFNPSFDEIVVESSLTVRGKSSQRQGKKLGVAPTVDPVTIKIASGVPLSTAATAAATGASTTAVPTSTAAASPSTSSSEKPS